MRVKASLLIAVFLLVAAPARAADVHLDAQDRTGTVSLSQQADGTWRVAFPGGTLTIDQATATAWGEQLNPTQAAPTASHFAAEMKSGTETLLADTSMHGPILAKYGRLLVYAPYFDQHLSWYPGSRTWVYDNLIRTQSTTLPTVDYMNGYTPAACKDLLDNDGDGKIDLADSGCASSADNDEGSAVTSAGEVWRAGDIRTAAFQDAWIQSARDLGLRGYTRLRLDDINPSEPLRSCATCAAYTPSWWLDANADFIERIRASLPGMGLECNISRWWTWGLPNVQPDMLRIIRACDEIELERGYNDANLTDAHRTTLLNDWQGLVKREGKGWVHFVQDGRLDYAKGWYDKVCAKWYPGQLCPGWLLTSDARAGLAWAGM